MTEIVRQPLAGYVLLVFLFNIIVFAALLLPALWTWRLPPTQLTAAQGENFFPPGSALGVFFLNDNPGLLQFAALFAVSIKLWCVCKNADPGCLSPDTIVSQRGRIRDLVRNLQNGSFCFLRKTMDVFPVHFARHLDRPLEILFFLAKN